MPKIVEASKLKQEATKEEKVVKPKKVKKVEREAIYTTHQVNGIDIPLESLTLTSEIAMELLDWEDEEVYRVRKLKENPKLKPESVGYGENFLLKDVGGLKINCWNNIKNREFDPRWCQKIVQDILNRHWRFNGESIVIGKTGLVISGQHRLIGLILAAQEWEEGKNKHHWREVWPEVPTIQACVWTGIEEDQKTVNTIDNTRPRHESDAVYTSDIFSDLEPGEKKLCSRMLGKALNLLWTRLNCHGSFEKYQTVATSMEWLERHGRLKRAVRHIYGCNQERVLSHNLRLSVGECSALLYLMAQSKSDPDDYRNGDPPSEEQLDFSLWERAEEFWLQVSKGHKNLEPVTKALQALIDLEGGRGTEKRAILAKAWAQFGVNHKATESDLVLEYDEKDGVPTGKLKDAPTFEGADQGERVPGSDNPDPSEVEVAEGTERQVGLFRIVREAGFWNVYNDEHDKPLASFKTEPQAEEWVRKEQEKLARREGMKEKLLENRKNGSKGKGKKKAEEEDEEPAEEGEEEIEEEG